MLYIEAPQELTTPDGIIPASVFLAGGITGCPDWQQDARMRFGPTDYTVLNPRRVDFPMDDPKEEHRQIAWEFKYLSRVRVTLFWFPKGAIQPIALYELGRFGTWSWEGLSAVAVGVEPGYERESDVRIQLSLAQPELPIFDTLADTCAQVNLLMAGFDEGS